jgi:hypothetical protein
MAGALVWEQRPDSKRHSTNFKNNILPSQALVLLDSFGLLFAAQVMPCLSQLLAQLWLPPELGNI